MAQVSTYTNPSAKKEERPFLAKSNPQYKEMMKELYHWFRTSEIINYCSSCRSILSRSAISIHKNCVRYSKMKILGKEILSILLQIQFLGSNKKKTEENLLKRAKNFDSIPRHVPEMSQSGTVPIGFGPDLSRTKVFEF